MKVSIFKGLFALHTERKKQSAVHSADLPRDPFAFEDPDGASPRKLVPERRALVGQALAAPHAPRIRETLVARLLHGYDERRPQLRLPGRVKERLCAAAEMSRETFFEKTFGIVGGAGLCIPYFKHTVCRSRNSLACARVFQFLLCSAEPRRRRENFGTILLYNKGNLIPFPAGQLKTRFRIVAAEEGTPSSGAAFTYFEPTGLETHNPGLQQRDSCPFSSETIGDAEEETPCSCPAMKDVVSHDNSRDL
uniref:Uncharacterized protein n=1 Tax=Steinernema glaseri TaxID=37863 RepID=A0A1I8AMK2_9BILA